MLCSVSLIICIIFVNNSLSMVAHNRSAEDIENDRRYFYSIVQPIRIITRASDITEDRPNLRDMMDHIQKDIERSIDEPEIYKQLKMLYYLLEQDFKTSLKISFKKKISE